MSVHDLPDGGSCDGSCSLCKEEKSDNIAVAKLRADDYSILRAIKWPGFLELSYHHGTWRCLLIANKPGVWPHHEFVGYDSTPAEACRAAMDALNSWESDE